MVNGCRKIAAVLAMMAGAGIAIAADAPVKPEKPDLKASLELAKKYDQYTHQTGDGTWEKGELLPTAKKEDADAWTVDGGAITIDGSGMKVEAAGAGCYVTLAKKTFKGPIGIRYEAMIPEGFSLCDLSVRFGPADSASLVAFAFGAYNNSTDFVIQGKTKKTPPNSPLIQAGKWHTVECLLTADAVIGKIDGVEIANEKAAVPLTDAVEHDLSLYVWSTTGIFRNVQILQYVPPKADARSWEEVMGKTTKDDLKALAVKMGPLLGDDDYATRQSAQDILYALRPLSDDVVREQLKRTHLEAKLRAENLGHRMGLIKDEPKQQTSPDGAEAPDEIDLNAGFNGGLIQLNGMIRQ